MAVSRKIILKQLATTCTVFAACCLQLPSSARAFSAQGPAPSIEAGTPSGMVEASSRSTSLVGYKPLSLDMEDFGVTIPVACWFPYSKAQQEAMTPTARARSATYNHNISVRKIGQLLARWNFIPSFASRRYELMPTSPVVMADDSLTTRLSAPVILLAHGYLGSRFDLSHLAERLADAGFVCLSAEYPESLAASYDLDNVDPNGAILDRALINMKLLSTLSTSSNDNGWCMKIEPTGFGIVGHSLGCGTVGSTGDETWARVCVAGLPRNYAGKCMLICSTGDGAVTLERMGGKEAIWASGYQPIDLASTTPLPAKGALVMDGPKAPNHISFLSQGVNNAMIEFLSPLLPIANAMSIPVLDFDRYKESQDSVETAAIVQPLIVRYLKQEMNVL